MAPSLSLEELQQENLVLTAQNALLQNQNVCLKEQLNWFQRQLFGKKSERNISQANEEQLTLEGFETKEVPPETKTIPAHTRRAPKRNGQDKITLPPDLPIETTILDLSEEEKASLVKIGEEVTYKLAFRPGSYFLKEIIRPKYAHPGKEEAGIEIASLPDSVIPKCRGDESFLADILTKKFADHLPLYRISEMLLREGIGISRQLLSQWVVKIGLALKPLYKVMLAKILESNNIFVDEVPVSLQEQDKQAYLWVLVGGNERDPAYRIYQFHEGRHHANAYKLLEDYHGVLHSDKFGAYETMAAKKQMIWCPCFSHISNRQFNTY
jgi:transposase